MITSFSSSRIYRALGVMIIMMSIMVVLLIRLHIERQVIIDSVDTHATEDTRIADLIKIARLARDNQGMVTDISNAFQSATDTVAVIESFESLGDAHQVHLEISKAEKVTAESGETSLALSAQAVGNWASVYGFIQSLDMFAYKHHTDRINLNKNMVEGTWVATIEMSVILETQ